jgi:hypothetical protein
MQHFVVYSVMGETKKDAFPSLDEALADFAEKQRLDALHIFDDRYVIGIEDSEGRRIDLGQVAA